MLDDQDKEKIRKIIQERKESDKFYSKNSETYKKFVEMEQATYSSGVLDKKIKELIATGISVVINCESCMEWHIHEAIKSGATKEELIEAIDVGVEMSGGPGTVSSRFALKVLEYYNVLD